MVTIYCQGQWQKQIRLEVIHWDADDLNQSDHLDIVRCGQILAYFEGKVKIC